MVSSSPWPTSFAVLSALFDALPLGVVVLDRAGRVVVFNRREEELARRSRAAVLGRGFFEEVAPCLDVRGLGGLFRERIGREPLDHRVEFSFAFPFLDRPRDVVVHLQSLQAEGDEYGLLLIEDVSAARTAERMREQLANLLVHDLKNPLAAIVGNTEFALEIARDTDQRDALEDVIGGTRRLERMILDLLDISRLETQGLPLALTLQDLRDVVAASGRNARGLARRSGVEVAVDLPAAPVLAAVDAEILRRALDNLAENAIRHSPRGATVRLGLAVDGTCTVADQGPGIPEALRERVFDKYVSVKAEGERGSNRGLGLTFVQLAAVAHGGTVRVDCPPEGGSRFRLQVPAATPPAG